MKIPDGWKLVPVEPTPEMIAAGNDKGCCVICMFGAMLASAPTPPASSAGEVEWVRKQRGLVLWCMHILGMDEVHAARDYDHACEMVADLSSSVFGKLPPSDDILVLPIVAPWPWDREAHAEDLLKTERIEAGTRAARAALASDAGREGGE